MDTSPLSGIQSKSLSPNSNGLADNQEGSPNQSMQQQGQANGSLSSSPEKPLHYTYLKGFRVEQCALFLQHKCTNHKPFTCFDWHFQNQRRRRPVRRRDGTFNYSPDTYCTKYDETTGLCPDKDDCPYLHKTAGDTERRYHLRYYKTGICVYETDSRGFCGKNGKHCAFAHGAQDLRNPVFDVRELQTLENGNTGGGEGLPDQAGIPSCSGTASTSIDRERNALLEDPRWNETAYVLANYKTILCKRPPRFCRQGYACPQYHNGKDRRRSPKLFKYRSTPCPNTKQGDEWVDPSKCEQGDQCPYCHSRTEQQFHPEIFKSTKCKDIQDTGYCPRGVFCAFAHNEDEIIATRDIDLDNIDTDSARPIGLSQYLGESQLSRDLENDNLQSTLESQLNRTIERLRPFNNLDDDDDIFSSNEIRRMSDRNDNIILGAQDNSDADMIVNNLLGIEPVIRPNSTSTPANSSIFSSPAIDLRGGSILQQQTASSAAAAAAVAAAASSLIRGPSLSNSLDINISDGNNLNELNLSNSSLSARTQNNTIVNSLSNTYNMELANSIAQAGNSRLGVSFADHNTSILPNSSLSNSNTSPNQTKNNLGPIARPRSYSHSQARSMNTDLNQLHAALARARLIDEFKKQSFGVNTNPNPIGFRERAVHSFSISSGTDSAPSLFNNNPVSALDFLPSSRISNLNLTSKDIDLNHLVNNWNSPLSGIQSKSLSPNSNGLANNQEGSPNQSMQQQGQANGSLSSSPEKPLHYTYLKGFRVEQCALFLQHKCTNHKPFTCFDWHFQNQRRRRPVRRRDGTFNYSPDTYCTKYDETTGLCPDKDDCPYLHKTAGDTERRYHLRYYKTGICVYETDSRGFCGKNGKHCAFAHGAQDLRNPVFDVRELQSLENGNSGGEISDPPGLPLSSSSAGATTSIDRERNALLEDPRWNETAYVLANYKTVLCKRPPRFCRQGYACPQYHNGKDRRRSPKIFKYRSTPCPNTKQGDEWVDPSKCEQGDQCPYCHSRTEQQFHPEIFKSTKCKDIQDTGYCPRGAFCAFAHNEEEIIATRDIDLDNVDTDSARMSELSQSYPGDTQLNLSQTNGDLQSTLESQLNSTIERLRPFNNLDDDDDIFSSNEIRRMSDRNDNIILGAQDNSDADMIVNNLLGIEPVIRPNSTSTPANSSIFSSPAIDLRGGSILQQQTASSAAAAAAVAAAASSLIRGPTFSNSLDINISDGNNLNELNLSNSLSARTQNNTIVNSLSSTYNMELANSLAQVTGNSRLGVSFADQNTSLLPNNSLSNNIAASPNRNK